LREEPKPTSSINPISTFGASAGGRSSASRHVPESDEPPPALHSRAVSLVSSNVLVTGATGGIGSAIARAFAARGAALTLTGRRADVLDALAVALGARALTCDLSVRDEVQRLAQAAIEAETDVLVANAALPGSGSLAELTQAQIDRMLEVNLRAPIALAHALAPGMINRGRGHLVFMSSLAGKTTAPLSSIYSATKFGLRGFALGLREDLRAGGVGVSVVFPGFVRDAGLFADANVRLPRGIGTVSPEDVAAGVLRAIERNKAEVDVAPVTLRVGATIGSLAPELAARVSRLAGGERIAIEHVEGQRAKRG
jgi:short-subunit dehydrogenase